MPVGPRNLTMLIVRRAKMQGFLVLDYYGRASEAIDDISKWATEGKLKPNVSHNFVLEDIQTAFKTVYERKVVGKAVIKFRRSQSAKL